MSSRLRDYVAWGGFTQPSHKSYAHVCTERLTDLPSIREQRRRRLCPNSRRIPVLLMCLEGCVWEWTGVKKISIILVQELRELISELSTFCKHIDSLKTQTLRMDVRAGY